MSEDYRPILSIKGIFAPGQRRNISEIMSSLNYMYENYYLQVFDGTFVEGIILEDDLNKPYQYWHPMWRNLRDSMNQFRDNIQE